MFYMLTISTNKRLRLLCIIGYSSVDFQKTFMWVTLIHFFSEYCFDAFLLCINVHLYINTISPQTFMHVDGCALKFGFLFRRVVFHQIISETKTLTILDMIPVWFVFTNSGIQTLTVLFLLLGAVVSDGPQAADHLGTIGLSLIQSALTEERFEGLCCHLVVIGN